MAKIPYEIATFNGGVAENVIPSKAEATLVIRQTDKAAVEAVFAHSFSLAKDAYGAYETDMAFACEATALPELVLCKADKDGFIALTTGIHDGLYNVHNSDKSLSRTSSNIGIIALTAQSIFIEILARSSDELFLDQINHSHINLANCFGFTTHTHSRLPAWPNDTNAHLPHIMAEAYKRQTDTDAVICLVHGNAEGSWFYTKNPRMEIVGCGSESMGYHTPSETLYLNSVNDFVKVLIDAIEHLG